MVLGGGGGGGRRAAAGKEAQKWPTHFVSLDWRGVRFLVIFGSFKALLHYALFHSRLFKFFLRFSRVLDTNISKARVKKRKKKTKPEPNVRKSFDITLCIG